MTYLKINWAGESCCEDRKVRVSLTYEKYRFINIVLKKIFPRQVFTCGDYQKGQLGRIMPPASVEPSFDPDPYSAHPRDYPPSHGHSHQHHSQSHHSHHQSPRRSRDSHNPPYQPPQQPLWHARPGCMPGIGAKFGRRATWIGASSDQTFLKVDESLINAHTLPYAAVFANATSIGLVPPPCGGPEDYLSGRLVSGGGGGGIVRGLSEDGVKCLMISRLDGSCKSFCETDCQWDLTRHSCYLDPIYDILWSYSPQTQMISCFNVVVTETPALINGGSGSGSPKNGNAAVEVRLRHKALTSSLTQVRNNPSVVCLLSVSLPFFIYHFLSIFICLSIMLYYRIPSQTSMTIVVYVAIKVC